MTDRKTYENHVEQAREAILGYLDENDGPVDAMEIIRFYNPAPIIRHEFLSAAFTQMLNRGEIEMDGERKVSRP